MTDKKMYKLAKKILKKMYKDDNSFISYPYDQYHASNNKRQYMLTINLKPSDTLQDSIFYNVDCDMCVIEGVMINTLIDKPYTLYMDFVLDKQILEDTSGKYEDYKNYPPLQLKSLFYKTSIAICE